MTALPDIAPQGTDRDNALPPGPLVAWCGDDFTGSAATMEVLEFAGLPSVLFLDIPTPQQLARFPGVRGIGIATTARSHPPAWMDENLPRIFTFLRDTGARIVHYKVCSTLDSAPEVGSIGRAIDIALPIVGGDWIPCLIAAPVMRRYQLFGQLFAAMGDKLFRLDKHPVMSRHPVTPMTEPDVAAHLARQTAQPMGQLSVEDIESAPARALALERGTGARVITLDATTQAHMETNGALIWGEHDGQRFAVGSQGIEYALVAHWRDTGLIPTEDRTSGAGPVPRMLAVSGSASPVTADQITWAEANGFAPIALDAAAVVLGEARPEEAAITAALKVLSDGRDPLVFSARGPDDPAIAAARAAALHADIPRDTANARIGAALGRILARLLAETGIRRAVISGGDTSGHAAKQLGIYAFTARAPTIPAAALLEAHSENPNLSGLQLALKGGQMGSTDYFGWIKRGGGAA